MTTPFLAGCVGRCDRDGASALFDRLGRMLSRAARSGGQRFADEYCAVLHEARSTQSETQIDGVHIWMHGEAFSDRNVRGVVAAVALGKEAASALASIDGVFACVAYVPADQRVLLATDRLGLRRMHWRLQEGRLAFCSEEKGFFAFSETRPALRAEVVKSSAGLGDKSDSASWFDGVQMLDAATVLEWRFGDDAVRIKAYDSQESQENPLQGDETELCEEMARLFDRAVERRVQGVDPIGVTLSGGLDSRLILGASIDTGARVVTSTAGMATSADQRIARRVADRAGSEHHPAPMDESRWLTDRLDMVWRLDGRLTIDHMHVLEAARTLGEHCAVNLDGFLGDIVAGGSSIRKHGDNVLGRVLGYGRQHVMLGVMLEEQFLNVRMPFVDHEFLDFMLRVPVELRAKSRIYRRMLLQRCPALFEDIPTAAGPKVGSSRLVTGFYGRWWRTYTAARRWSRRFGPAADDPRSPAPYATWLRRKPSRDIVTDHLASNDTVLCDYVEKRDIALALDAFLSGREGMETTTRMLTTEAWLRACKEHAS